MHRHMRECCLCPRRCTNYASTQSKTYGAYQTVHLASIHVAHGCSCSTRVLRRTEWIVFGWFALAVHFGGSNLRNWSVERRIMAIRRRETSCPFERGIEEGRGMWKWRHEFSPQVKVCRAEERGSTGNDAAACVRPTPHSFDHGR